LLNKSYFLLKDNMLHCLNSNCQCDHRGSWQTVCCFVPVSVNSNKSVVTTQMTEKRWKVYRFLWEATEEAVMASCDWVHRIREGSAFL